MPIYDSHCHYLAVANDLRQQKVAVPGIVPEDINELIAYRKHNHQAKIGLGLHPWYIDQIHKYASLQEFKENLELMIAENQPDFLGETGLDKNKPDLESQLASLQIHCELAAKYKLPVVIHCVRAINELLHLIKNFSDLPGIVHAYNGNSESAKQLWKHGLYVGIGSIILNNNSQLCKSASKIPEEQIILESDAPYMPAFDRQTSSSNDCLIYAQRISQLKEMSLSKVIANSNHNWNQLFNN